MRANPFRIAVTVDGQTYIATTRWSQPSAHVLTAHTILPNLPFAAEVHSTFIGHDNTPVHASHLLLGPIGAEHSVHTKELERGWYHPGSKPRACVYEHCVQLVELLCGAGYDARVRTPSLTATELGA